MSEPFRRSRSKGVGYDCTSCEGSFVGGMGREEGGKEEEYKYNNMEKGSKPKHILFGIRDNVAVFKKDTQFLIE